jgi:hypothetical protein
LHWEDGGDDDDQTLSPFLAHCGGDVMNSSSSSSGFANFCCCSKIEFKVELTRLLHLRTGQKEEEEDSVKMRWKLHFQCCCHLYVQFCPLQSDFAFYQRKRLFFAPHAPLEFTPCARDTLFRIWQCTLKFPIFAAF